MGFLDSTGLARVWSRVKAALGLKMDKSVYDPGGKAQDVFAYADQKAEAAVAALSGGLLQIRAVTLAAGGWPEAAPFTQTAAVPGVLADEARQGIWPAPASGSVDAWTASEVTAAAQGADSLTFSAQSRPEADLTVSILMLEAL